MNFLLALEEWSLSSNVLSTEGLRFGSFAKFSTGCTKEFDVDRDMEDSSTTWMSFRYSAEFLSKRRKRGGMIHLNIPF